MSVHGKHGLKTILHNREEHIMSVSLWFYRKIYVHIKNMLKIYISSP
jgi:hypothetical protein